MSRRGDIWITGVGAHTAAGAGTAAMREALFGPASLARPMESLGGHWVARAPDPAIGKLGKRLDRSSQFFVAAAREAWQQAGLDRALLDPDRIAVIDGSALGPTSELLATERERTREGFSERMHPAQLLRMMFGAGGAAFAQEIGARGPVFALSAGSTSGALAVIEAWEKLQLGVADVVVAGGADAPLDPEVLRVFAAAGILAPPEPALPCRPFDVNRHGTILGEGAGVLVLETATHAARRAAEPLGILLGGGLSGEDASLAGPDPQGRGVTRAAAAALRTVPLNRVGWIKAHGTGTRLNDAAECRGLSGLADHAPITSLKPLLGHCLGASGAVELVAAVLAMHARIVPPTLGTVNVDPALGEFHVALEPEPLRSDAALLLSESLGGRCVAVALGRAA